MVQPTEEEIMQEVQKLQEEQTEDSELDRMELSQEMQEAYGAPEPEEVQNQASFLHKAAFFSPDTVRTTFLHESELGRPLFSIRFLMDLENLSAYYLDEFCAKFQIVNKIKEYFHQKRETVTSSGMSNKGFAMNLNVTRKIDATRKRVRESSIENLKGGKIKQ